MLGEVVGRHTNGVLGRDVKFALVLRRVLADGETPTPDEQARIDEATGWLNEWVDARKLNQAYDVVGKTLAYAGVACQRPFVAPGELDERGNVPAADIRTNLGRVHVHFPHPGSGARLHRPAHASESAAFT